MAVIDRLDGSVVRPSDRRWRRLVLAMLLVDVALVVVNGNWLADYLRAEGPPFPPDAGALIWIHLVAIALGLIVAAPAFALISHLGRRAEVPLGAGVLAVMTGVFAFLVAAQINDAIVVSMGLIPGGGPDDAFDLVSLVVAPAVEEPTKLLAVGFVAVLLRPLFGIRQGIVLGLLVGIGATLVEAGASLQIQYAAGGGPIYGTMLAVRFGLFGLGLHATTAALTGAGLGYAAAARPGPRRIGVIALALVTALAIHVMWNVWASRLTFDLVTALTPEPAFGTDEPFAHHVLLFASSIVTAVLLAPAGLVLAVAWRRSGRQPVTVPTEAAVSEALGA
jgi:RsiW-degrading membrane proteinase PrsW (M82 family)